MTIDQGPNPHVLKRSFKTDPTVSHSFHARLISSNSLTTGSHCNSLKYSFML